ncbi:MAG: arylsulfotransferase family protein [Halobacteriales archaeon]
MSVPRPSRTTAIVLLGVVCLLSTGIVVVEYVHSEVDGTAGTVIHEQANRPYEQRDSIAPTANGTTVITAQKFRRNFIVAFAPDGRVRYFNDSLDRYHDVDPVPGDNHTVEFIGAVYDGDTTYQLLQRVNLTTGTTETVYRYAIPRTDASHRWHDVDRIDNDTVIVADIARDAVAVVNTTSGERSYEWPAQAAYSPSTGGDFRTDWTHINDIEVLPDGRYMASLRNHDTVVFIDPGKGIDRSWTLGADDDHRTLYEQHNPDYISSAVGQPAVLVADSENNRIVEYRRVNGSWVQSWTWRDKPMQWPRDADRLPNGHTLIGDTHSSRVIEIDEDGDIVWQVKGLPSYDVERLGTGDESQGGRSAAELELGDRTVASKRDGLVGRSFGRTVVGLVPNKLQNTISFVTPLWLSAIGQVAAAISLVSGFFLFGIGLIRGYRRHRR